MRCVDRVDAGSREDHQARALIQGVITVVMRSGGAHPDRSIVIQRTGFKRFYNPIDGSI